LLPVQALRWSLARGQRLLPQSGHSTMRISSLVTGRQVWHQHSGFGEAASMAAHALITSLTTMTLAPQPCPIMLSVGTTGTSCIFKGVHYEMLVQTREGYELMVQDYHAFEAGREVGLLVKPFDIHVMKKERTCNTFEGKLVDETHVDFLGCNFECLPVQGIEPGSAVQVEVDFQHVILEDNEEDGRLTGEVKFILYKGNHYHLTVFTDWDEDIFVDTNDVWDDGDRVGITIAPQNIRIVQSLNKEGSAQ
jgi:hypothetical protein